MTKHAAIYPSEDELQSIQKIVSITERALKLVSDIISDQDKSGEEEAEDPPKDRHGPPQSGHAHADGTRPSLGSGSPRFSSLQAPEGGDEGGGPG